MKLHEIHAVAALKDEPDGYTVTATVTDADEVTETVQYISRASDVHGLAPAIRAAVDQWIADGKTITPYTPPTPEQIRAGMPPLTARQLRLGLVNNDIMPSQVQTAIDAIADPTEREKAQIEWQYASEYQRVHPLIDQLGTALSLTDEQIDAMWTAALSL